MLEFKNVCFRYDSDEQDIVDDLSFHIHPGDFVSLIGISGCGKSTIFKLTNGILKKKAGQILQNGKDITSLKTVAAGYMPQKDLLFPWRTIMENICLPMEIAGIPVMQQRERAAQMLKEVGLSDYADKYPRDLSGGMRQRISFARTILTDAPLLLLDEPFSALDALTRMNMQEWLLHEWQHPSAEHERGGAVECYDLLKLGWFCLMDGCCQQHSCIVDEYLYAPAPVEASGDDALCGIALRQVDAEDWCVYSIAACEQL